jgi:hypothetical protein
MEYAKVITISSIAVFTCFTSYVLGDTGADEAEKDIEYYAEITKTRYSSYLGVHSEAQGIEQQILEPLPIIDIYGDLQAYLFVCFTGLGEPMAMEEAKTLGERGLGENYLRADYKHYYGFTVTPVVDNLLYAPSGGPVIPPEIYNYSLSEQKAKDILETDDISFLGLVCKFKYDGLLFEGGGNKLLIDPKQFDASYGLYGTSDEFWYYYTWDALEPHLNEWSCDTYYYRTWYDKSGQTENDD